MTLTDVTSVAVGSKAPDFELQTDTGETWRLSDQIGNVVALLLYPKDETLVCTKQLCFVRDNWNDYLETRASVIGVSPAASKSIVNSLSVSGCRSRFWRTLIVP